MGKQPKGKISENRTKLIITVLLLITFAALAVTIWALFFRTTAPVLTPDYAPQKADEYAEPVTGDDEEKMEVSEGGGAVSMVYQKEVSISLSNNMASLLFQNPSKSVNDIVLQLVIISEDGTETVIAQSGTLSPGYGIEQLELIKDAAKLSEGSYTGRYNVLYYDPDSGERAVLNGNIEGIEITVTN